MKLINWCNRNHCTCFVDRFFGTYLGNCCKQHDKDYESTIKRKTADKRFYVCLKKATYKPLAYLMYKAVRLFGKYFRKTKEA
jgi:hypothetical protein